MEIQWSLVFFAAFICWGAGTYVAAVLFHELLKAPGCIVRPAFAVGAAAVLVGAVASMTHLGHLERIFGVLSNPGSGIFIEGLSSALLVAVVLVYLIAVARKASSVTLRVLAIVGIVPALAVIFAVGSSYLMVARPAWDVMALPLVSITAALSMGSVPVLAIFALTAGRAKNTPDVAATSKRMGAAAAALIVAQALAVVAYTVSVAVAPYQDSTRSAVRMVSGDMALLFWGLVVFLGIVVPFAVVLIRNRRGAAASISGEAASRSAVAWELVVAVACMLVAVIAFRVIMFSLGSSIVDFGFTL